MPKTYILSGERHFAPEGIVHRHRKYDEENGLLISQILRLTFFSRGSDPVYLNSDPLFCTTIEGLLTLSRTTLVRSDEPCGGT